VELYAALGTTRIRVVAVLIAAVAVSSAAFRAEEPVVAVLGENPCERDSTGPIVRIMFAKDASGWRTLDTNTSWTGLDLGKRVWTIALDGRDRGHVRTPELPGQPTVDRRDRFLKIAPGETVPRIANTAKHFSGWCDHPKTRPIVLVSGGSAADPEAWKPYAVPANLRDSIFPAFAKVHAGLDMKAVTCDKNDHSSPLPVIPANVVVEPKGYRNAAGLRLVWVHFDRKKDTCDGLTSDEWADHTFLITDRPVHLGAFLELVDAGDYDGDGRSEQLFFFGKYDYDGYMLFSDNFTRSTTYGWSYH
jgi:hypothetical protein